jgi:GNAT superfamily N-acetyltransferase
MKTSYYKLLSPVKLAVLDVCPFEDGFLIPRINVPMAFRGLGHASALLRECTNDADSENVPLYLTTSPSDGLDYKQLEQFYMRNGLLPWHTMYRRAPIARTT